MPQIPWGMPKVTPTRAMSDGSAGDGSPGREPAEEEPLGQEPVEQKSIEKELVEKAPDEVAPDEKAEPASGEGSEDSVSRQARLEAAKRRYRATLRNEAETEGGGFSEDYYRSQKPPHW